MSTEAAGYWPLSYHGGSVWTHDSAIIARGMARAGLHDAADLVVDGLLAAAEGFAFRVPELHSGDSSEVSPHADAVSRRVPSAGVVGGRGGDGRVHRAEVRRSAR